MKKCRSDLKILLLQIREDEVTIQEELYEFAQFSNLPVEQFSMLNSFLTPDFDPNVIDGFDALFVGGSSDASVLHPETYTFMEDCRRLLRYCYDKDIPVLASCFGFQVAVEEFGGKVILDKDNMEMGIYQVKLTDAAKDDPLLFDMPEIFWAVSGHKERAVTIPENATHLGYSEACPHHIIKLVDKPFYAFQFHPEVNREDLHTRIVRYQERYLEDAGALQKVLDHSTQETTEANRLIQHFVDRIMLA